MTTRAPPATANAGGSRHRPGCADEEVGRSPDDVGGRGGGSEPHIDTEAVELTLEIEDEVEQLLACRPGRGLPQLTANDVLALEEDDGVPRLGGDARRLEAGRAAAGDDDAARLAIAASGSGHSASRPSRGLIVHVTPPA